MARKMKTGVPKKIAEPPTLPSCLVFYYEAFLTLSSCRQVSMSEYRIPWTAANEYGKRYEMLPFEFEDFWVLLSAMDAVYIKHRNKESEKRQQGARKPPVGKPDDSGNSAVHVVRKGHNQARR